MEETFFLRERGLDSEEGTRVESTGSLLLGNGMRHQERVTKQKQQVGSCKTEGQKS